MLECTAIGVADERLGEDIAVMIYADASALLTQSILQEHVKELLAGFKVPKVNLHLA